ncbi:MAG: hypothetical protein K2L98_03520 [Bacilli bacterium]|nr:hypothetical protein [Bacilli bacterium]
MEESRETKRIITEKGLFYSNFDKIKFNLALMPDSEYYSRYLVRLRDEYGIAIGEQQPDSNGETHENTIGVYIVDYQGYLRELNAKRIIIREEDFAIPEDTKESNTNVARLR